MPLLGAVLGLPLVARLGRAEAELVALLLDGLGLKLLLGLLRGSLLLLDLHAGALGRIAVLLLAGDDLPRARLAGGFLRIPLVARLGGLKAALGIGQEANDNILAEFTGSKDTVVHAYSGGQLAQMIKIIAVTSSQIGSKSMTLSNETGEEVENEDVFAAKQKLLGQQIQEFVGDQNNGDVPFDIGW